MLSLLARGRPSPQPSTAGPRLAAFVAAAALLLGGAAPAHAATDAELQRATDAAVAFFTSNQTVDGELGCLRTAPSCAANPFGGDWSLLGLAAAGVHAADLSRASAPGAPANPSAQDYFRTLWTTPGPDGGDQFGNLPGAPLAASDYARTIIMSHAAGLDPARLSAAQNLVAKLAQYYQPSIGSFGGSYLLNQHLFAAIALRDAGFGETPAGRDFLAFLLRRVEADQRPDGAFERSVDLQGAALFALCEGGRASVADPAIAKGVDYLLGLRQHGLFGNTSSTNWALTGLTACGVTRGSARWAAEGLEATIDDVLARQIASTSGDASAGGMPLSTGSTANVYESQALLAILAARSFSVDPPPRRDPTDPLVRPAPVVDAGTPIHVPILIEQSPDDFRFCSTDTTVGTPIAQLLRDAVIASRPSKCVVGPAFAGGALTSLNGLRGGDGTWTVSVSGGADGPLSDQVAGFGDLVALRFTPTPPTDPATTPVPTPVPDDGALPATDGPTPSPTPTPTSAIPPTVAPEPTPTPQPTLEPAPVPTSAAPAAPAPPAPPAQRAVLLDAPLTTAALARRVTIRCRPSARGLTISCAVSAPATVRTTITVAGSRSADAVSVSGSRTLTLRRPPTTRAFRSSQRLSVRLSVGNDRATRSIRVARRLVVLL